MQGVIADFKKVEINETMFRFSFIEVEKEEKKNAEGHETQEGKREETPILDLIDAEGKTEKGEDEKTSSFYIEGLFGKISIGFTVFPREEKGEQPDGDIDIENPGPTDRMDKKGSQRSACS